MKFITTKLLHSVGEEAKSSARLRKNYNFHRHDETVQRFLNALQPETYVPPHKHPGAEHFEFYCVLQGSIGLVIFNDSCEVIASHKISATGEIRGVEIPGDTWHSLVCLEPGSVILEIKEGPYNPDAMKYFLPGFPDELAVLRDGPTSGSGKKVSELLQSWRRLFN